MFCGTTAGSVLVYRSFLDSIKSLQHSRKLSNFEKSPEYSTLVSPKEHKLLAEKIATLQPELSQKDMMLHETIELLLRISDTVESSDR